MDKQSKMVNELNNTLNGKKKTKKSLKRVIRKGMLYVINSVSPFLKDTVLFLTLLLALLCTIMAIYYTICSKPVGAMVSSVCAFISVKVNTLIEEDEERW